MRLWCNSGQGKFDCKYLSCSKPVSKRSFFEKHAKINLCLTTHPRNVLFGPIPPPWEQKSSENKLWKNISNRGFCVIFGGFVPKPPWPGFVVKHRFIGNFWIKSLRYASRKRHKSNTPPLPKFLELNDLRGPWHAKISPPGRVKASTF